MADESTTEEEPSILELLRQNPAVAARIYQQLSPEELQAVLGNRTLSQALGRTALPAVPASTGNKTFRVLKPSVTLGPEEEAKFQADYKRTTEPLGLNPDPDDPQHFYDWRSAWKAGKMAPDESGHFPSEYKREGHPNLVVGGVDTRTGKPVSDLPLPSTSIWGAPGPKTFRVIKPEALPEEPPPEGLTEKLVGLGKAALPVVGEVAGKVGAGAVTGATALLQPTVDLLSRATELPFDVVELAVKNAFPTKIGGMKVGQEKGQKELIKLGQTALGAYFLADLLLAAPQLARFLSQEARNALAAYRNARDAKSAGAVQEAVTAQTQVAPQAPPTTGAAPAPAPPGPIVPPTAPTGGGARARQPQPAATIPPIPTTPEPGITPRASILMRDPEVQAAYATAKREALEMGTVEDARAMLPKYESGEAAPQPKPGETRLDKVKREATRQGFIDGFREKLAPVRGTPEGEAQVAAQLKAQAEALPEVKAAKAKTREVAEKVQKQLEGQLAKIRKQAEAEVLAKAPTDETVAEALAKQVNLPKEEVLQSIKNVRAAEAPTPTRPEAIAEPLGKAGAAIRDNFYDAVFARAVRQDKSLAKEGYLEQAAYRAAQRGLLESRDDLRVIADYLRASGETPKNAADALNKLASKKTAERLGVTPKGEKGKKLVSTTKVPVLSQEELAQAQATRPKALTAKEAIAAKAEPLTEPTLPPQVVEVPKTEGPEFFYHGARTPEAAKAIQRSGRITGGALTVDPQLARDYAGPKGTVFKVRTDKLIDSIHPEMREKYREYIQSGEGTTVEPPWAGKIGVETEVEAPKVELPKPAEAAAEIAKGDLAEAARIQGVLERVSAEEAQRKVGRTPLSFKEKFSGEVVSEGDKLYENLRQHYDAGGDSRAAVEAGFDIVPSALEASAKKTAKVPTKGKPRIAKLTPTEEPPPAERIARDVAAKPELAKPKYQEYEAIIDQFHPEGEKAYAQTKPSGEASQTYKNLDALLKKNPSQMIEVPGGHRMTLDQRYVRGFSDASGKNFRKASYGKPGEKGGIPLEVFQPIAKKLQQVGMRLNAAFRPYKFDPTAKVARDVIHGIYGPAKGEISRAVMEAEELVPWFEKLSKGEAHSMIVRAERKLAPVTEEETAFRSLHQNLVNLWWRMADDLAAKTGKSRKQVFTGYRENYIVHFQRRGKEREAQAATLGERISPALRPLGGAKEFRKRRTLSENVEDIQGMDIEDFNPLRLLLKKHSSVMQHFSGEELKLQANSAGIRKYYKHRDKAPPGWVKDPTEAPVVYYVGKGGRRPTTAGYYMPEGAARALRNFLSPGLWNSGVYRGWRELTNRWAGIRVSFSGFHWGTLAQNAAALRLDNAIRAGKPLAALGTQAPGASMMRYYQRGKKLVDEWKASPIGSSAPKEVQQFLETGMEVMPGREYLQATSNALTNAVDRVLAGHVGTSFPAKQLGKALRFGSGRVLMEDILPRLKIGAFAETSEIVLAKLPPNATEAMKKDALWEVADMIENFFGHMTYDRLGTNRAMINVAHLLVAYPGWNLGVFRNLAGAVGDTRKLLPAKIENNVLKLNTPKLDRRVTRTLGVLLTTAIQGAFYQRLITGKWPEFDPNDYWTSWRNFFHVKNGQKDADGNDQRITPFGHMRDIENAAISMNDLLTKHDATELRQEFAGKQSLAPMLASWLFYNADWKDQYVLDPEKPALANVAHLMRLLGESSVPFPISREIRRREEGPFRQETTQDPLETLMGVNPASPYWRKGEFRAELEPELQRHRQKGPFHEEELLSRKAKRTLMGTRLRKPEEALDQAEDFIKRGYLKRHETDRILDMDQERLVAEPIVSELKEVTKSDEGLRMVLGRFDSIKEPREQAIVASFLDRKLDSLSEKMTVEEREKLEPLIQHYLLATEKLRDEHPEAFMLLTEEDLK